MSDAVPPAAARATAWRRLAAAFAVVLFTSLTTTLPAHAERLGRDGVSRVGERDGRRLARVASTGYGPAVNVIDWPVPTGNAGLPAQWAGKGIVAWQGEMVFAEQGANKLGFVSMNGAIREEELAELPNNSGSAANGPSQLATRRGDALYMRSGADGYLLRVDPAAGQALVIVAGLAQLAADATGGAWFTTPVFGSTYYFDAANQQAGEFATDTSDPRPLDVAADGTAWVGDGHSTLLKVGKDGSILRYPAPGILGDLHGVAVGTDRVWYAKLLSGGGTVPASGGVLGSVSLATGQATEYANPLADGADLLPGSLITGPGNTAWFTTPGGLGRLTPDGAISLVSLPQGRVADSLAFGPDGNLWFTDSGLNRIGRVTLADFAAASGTSSGGATAPQVGSKKLDADRRRNFATLRVACPPRAARCKGRVQVRYGRSLVGTGSFSVKSGTTKRATVKLNRRARALLRQRPKAPVKVVLVTKAGLRVVKKLTLTR